MGGMPPRPPGIRQYALVPDDGFTVFRYARDIPPGISVGRRVVVTGMAGAGKSTFSRALSAKTGLPVIHLDVHFWKPGWVEPSEDEWRKKQRDQISSDEWILDGNYHATLDLRLERSDTAWFEVRHEADRSHRATKRAANSTAPELRRGRSTWNSR
jgi:hypothetical protein